MANADQLNGSRVNPTALLVALGVVSLGTAAAVGLSAAINRLWRLDDVLGTVLPFDTRLTDPLDAVLGAVAFAALAIGLVQRRRLSWLLATVLLSSAVILQAVVLRHPIGAALGAVVVVLLFALRRSFGVQSGRPVLALAGAVGIAAAALGLLAAVIAAGGATAASAERAIADVAGAFTFTDPRTLALLDRNGNLLDLPVTAVRVLVAVVAVLALIAAPLADAGSSARDRLRWIADRHGKGALLPHQLDGDKLVFAPDDLDAVVVYGRAGRHAVALGDPIGSIADAWEAFKRFDEACQASGLVPTVYQASASSRGPLAARGFRSILVGREAVVELATFSLAGPRRANLRHTITRAQRGGTTVEVHLDGLHDAARTRLLPGLEAIEARWRDGAGPELRFTIGHFEPTALSHAPLAVALEADGTPTAFATFLPTGVDGGWALDLMRRMPDGTPGAFEACIAAAAQEMHARGATTLSLGLAPLAGLSNASSVWDERLLASIAKRVKPWYDVSGLEFFKAKFDPVWEPRYVAARTRLQLAGLVIALLRLHVGGFGHAVRGSAASALHLSHGVSA